MKMKEIKDKSGSDLEKMLTDKRESLRLFRFGAAGAKTKNVKAGRAIRKDIARILTTINMNHEARAKKSIDKVSNLK